MKRVLLATMLLTLLFAGLRIVTGQGPLTNALNLQLRSDSNGALFVYGVAAGAQGPLTSLGNMQLRAYSPGALAVTLVAGSSFTAPFTLSNDGIITTSTDALILSNATAATAGVPVQQSGRLRFRSQVWNSTVTAITNTNDFFLESVPVTGATPSGLLKFGSSLNGAAATYPMTLTSGGVLKVTEYGTTGATHNRFLAPDGGAYLLEANGSVIVNSATLQLANALTPMIVFNNPTTTGLLVVTNGAGTTGVGLDIATDNILAVRVRAHNADAAVRASIYNSSTLSALTFSTNTIAPTSSIHTIGAGLIKTITVPATCTPTCSFMAIPTAAYTYDATGNVTVPVGGGLALISKVMVFVWDGSKWNPSY
jgi:hypothetical protein